MADQAPTAGTEHESIVSVDIDAAPEDVWHALTTEDGLAGWMGDGSQVGERQGDDLIMADIVTGQQRRGVLDEVSPQHRLGYTWWPETDPDQATRVSITLVPCPSGTRVTVVETVPSASLSAHATAVASWPWRAALLSLCSLQVPCRG